jgi:hypothetical protein
MFKLLVIINHIDYKKVTTEVIDFRSLSEAEIATDQIKKNDGGLLIIKVIKLYKN